MSSEAILAPLGSVVSCVAGAGAEDDDAGVGRTSPCRGSVMGTPEEKKREAEAAAAAIGATPMTAEEEDDDDATELLANADAAARPARGSRPESSEAALEDETMFFLYEFGEGERRRKEESFCFFFSSRAEIVIAESSLRPRPRPRHPFFFLHAHLLLHPSSPPLPLRPHPRRQLVQVFKSRQLAHPVPPRDLHCVVADRLGSFHRDQGFCG